MLEHLVVRAHRRIDVVATLIVELGRLDPERAREIRIVGPAREVREERDEIVPAVLRARDRFEVRERLGVLGHGAERAAERIERTCGVADLTASDLTDLGEQLELARRLFGARDEHLERADERLPVVPDLVDRLEDRRRLRAERGIRQERFERDARAVVLRDERDDLAMEIEGALPIVQVLLEHLREAELERRELFVVRRAEVDATLERVGEILVARLLLEERVERAIRFLLVVAPLREDRAVRVDRVVRLGELVLEQRRAAVRDAFLRVGIRLEIEAAIVDRDQLAELRRLAIERLELADRTHVVGLGVVDGAELRDRLVDLADVLEHGAELHLEVDARLGIRAALDRLLVRSDDLVPAVDGRSEPRDVLAEDLLHRIELERRQEAREREVRLLQLLFVEKTRLAQQRDALVLVRDVLEANLVHAGELLRVVDRLVDRRERDGRIEALRIELEHLLVGLRGLVVLVLSLPEARDAEHQIDLLFLRRVLVPGLALERTDELVELAARCVERLEIVPRLDRDVATLELLLRALVLGIEREQALERADGAVIVVELVRVDHAELREHGLLFFGAVRALGLSLEHVGERLPLARTLVEARERRERIALIRIVLTNLLPEVDADLGLAEALRRELRHLDVSDRAVALVHELDLALHDADELFPVAALLVHLLELRDRIQVVRVVLEHGLEGFDRLGLVRRLLEVHRAGLREQADLLLAVLNDVDLREDALDDVGPALLTLELRDGLVELAELRLLRVRQLTCGDRLVRLHLTPPQDHHSRETVYEADRTLRTVELRQPILRGLQVVRGRGALRCVDVALQVTTRFVAVVLQRVGPAETEHRLLHAGLDVERGVELRHGLIVVALLLVDGAEEMVEIRLVLGAGDHDLQAALQNLHGLGEVAEIGVEPAERAVRFDEARAVVDRIGVVLERALRVVLPLVDLAELVVGLEQVRIDVDRVLERGLRLIPLLELHEHRAELLVVTGDLRVDLNRAIQIIASRIEPLHLHVDDGEIPIRLIVGRIDRGCVLELLDRVEIVLLRSQNDTSVHLVQRLDALA